MDLSTQINPPSSGTKIEVFQDHAQTIFRQLPWRSMGFMEINMFQELVLAMFHVIYDRGLLVQEEWTQFLS